jgi:CRP/FNR family transcriptional regulator
MIHPELLSKYPLFSFFTPAQLKKIAKIAVEQPYGRGSILFRENERADAIYILLKGSVELLFVVEVEYHPELRKEFRFRVIYPGETFGISAFIEPYLLTSTARAVEPSLVIRIDAEPVLEMCQKDDKLAYSLIQQVARTAMDRLNATRLQLAAVWKPAVIP